MNRLMLPLPLRALRLTRITRAVALLVLLLSSAAPLRAQEEAPRSETAAARSAPGREIAEWAAGYVARKDGLRTFFNALSAQLKKPVIVSQKASRKQISGEFELDKPQVLLERIAAQLGLVWYHDGQTIYVYDASELQNAVPSTTWSLKCCR
ncbi:MAG: EscC/YscC/HrcC family type secretion system outer rane ring protein [Herbaspirillum sp.]|nr:EscC/YscC/HrcC family type secretion system outer rane ring protein [Herbaspirillum sp.]